jgi:toxin ParE1/3/4
VAHKVIFRPEAEADLFALYRYIAENSGDTRAAEYVERIVTTCMNLADFPLRGTLRNDLAPGIRITGFERRATIAFRVEDDTVRIVRVFYAGRDFEAALYQDPDQDE